VEAEVEEELPQIDENTVEVLSEQVWHPRVCRVF
jgi:hypothetical protein